MRVQNAYHRYREIFRKAAKKIVGVPRVSTQEIDGKTFMLEQSRRNVMHILL